MNRGVCTLLGCLAATTAVASPRLPALAAADTAQAQRSPLPFYRMGSALYVGGDYVQAARWFARAAERSSEPRYFVLRARSLARGGQTDEARVLLERVAALHTGHDQAQAFFYLGWLHLGLAQYSRALEALARSLEHPAPSWEAQGVAGMYLCAANLGFSGRAHRYRDRLQHSWPRLLERHFVDSVQNRSYRFADPDFGDAMLAHSRPPAADRKDSPGAAAPGAPVYAVQAGSFSDRENAAGLYETLAAVLAQVSLEESVVNGVTWYRVRVGSFASRREAEAFAADSLAPHAQSYQIVTR